MKESRMARKQRRQHLHDDGAGQKYFASIPHLLDYMGMPAPAYRLYGHYKHATSEDHQLCDQSTRELAEATGLSTGTISSMKVWLQQAGLIWIEEVDTPSGPGDAVRCVDIWPQNMAAFAKSDRSRRERIAEQIALIRQHAQPPKPKGVKRSVQILNASSPPAADASQESFDLEDSERSNKRSAKRSNKRSNIERSLKTVNNPEKPVKNPPLTPQTDGALALAVGAGGEESPVAGDGEPTDFQTVQFLQQQRVRNWQPFASLPFATVKDATADVRGNPGLIVYRLKQLQTGEVGPSLSPPAATDTSTAEKYVAMPGFCQCGMYAPWMEPGAPCPHVTDPMSQGGAP